MSEGISPILQPEQPVVPPSAVQPSSANAATAGQVAQGTQSSQPVSTMTQINSMGELKRKAPEVYEKMMEGIAMSVIQRNKEAQDRLKELWRKAREDSGSR